MITGFNANVRHRGRVFHVQTEDSGRAHPHVITHVYYEGTILASERRDYAQLVEAADLAVRVRQLMEDQHEAMVARLRGGEFDAMVDARLGGAGLAGAHPGEAATPAAARPPIAPARQPPAPRRPAPAAAPALVRAAPRSAPPAPVPAAGAPAAGAPAAGAPRPVPAAPVPPAEAAAAAPPAGADARAPASAPGGRPRAFGEGIVSRKPLDEVILEYLVEKSRGRTRTAGARGSRSDG